MYIDAWFFELGFGRGRKDDTRAACSQERRPSRSEASFRGGSGCINDVQYCPMSGSHAFYGSFPMITSVRTSHVYRIQ